ncbi:phage tail assembly chaperone [Clostridium sp. Marseille-Q7071]
MSTIDLLLKVDTNKLFRPEKQVEIKRLSELAGEKVVFTCQALNASEIEEATNNALTIKSDGEVDIKNNDMQLFVLLSGVKEPNLKSKELREYYECLTPKDLINKLLLPGEVSHLYNTINDLSGFGKGQVEEIKNS